VGIFRRERGVWNLVFGRVSRVCSFKRIGLQETASFRYNCRDWILGNSPGRIFTGAGSPGPGHARGGPCVIPRGYWPNRQRLVSAFSQEFGGWMFCSTGGGAGFFSTSSGTPDGGMVPGRGGPGGLCDLFHGAHWGPEFPTTPQTHASGLLQSWSGPGPTAGGTGPPPGTVGRFKGF